MSSSTLLKLTVLAKEKSSERRRELMREVTDLFFEAPPAEDDPLHAQFNAILSTLATEAALQARTDLAERFADAPVAPRELLLQLARDAIEVARPILQRSAVLNADDLIDIMETAGPAHMRAISTRDEVPAPVSEIIAEKGDAATVATLVANDGARLSRQAHETIARRAESNPMIQRPMIDRADTPPDLLHDLMLAVETSLRERIMSRFDQMGDGVLEAAMAASRARLEARMNEDRAMVEARRYIDARLVRRELDPPLLARLLRERELARFYVGFAELTGIDPDAARRAIEHEDVDLLALVCKASGVERAVFVTFAVLRPGAKGDGMAHARELGGAYDEIDPAAAQRTLRFWRMRRDMAAA